MGGPQVEAVLSQLATGRQRSASDPATTGESPGITNFYLRRSASGAGDRQTAMSKITIPARIYFGGLAMYSNTRTTFCTPPTERAMLVASSASLRVTIPSR